MGRKSCEFFQIETFYKCHICGSKLVLIEQNNEILFGCDKCGYYIRVTKREIYRELKRGKRINFPKVLKELYELYKETFITK